ncbi:MAG: hypothetical protein IT235_08675, partial [Bacteroidia bacterium]|nr:hypothetical protein [Bacteroidia bacterium]
MFAQRANYKVRHITIKEGLSQSFVTCVFQDSRGFMWFGTQDGLNLYDGSKITVFSNDPENNQSLGSNSITNIIEDKFGRLWIGTRNNGLSIYFPRNNTFKTLKHNEKNEKTISNNSIAELFYDKQGTVWASTSNGFNAINPVTFEAHRYYIPASDSTNVMINDIKLVLPNSQNKQLLWVISAAGVFKFNTENEIFTPVIIPGMNEKKIYNVAYDHAHRVYINTVSNSLKILDINLNKILDYSALKGIQLFYRTNEAIQVTCAYRTKDSISYLGTDKKGVMVINEKTNELKVINAESPSNVLLSNKIQYMYFDSSGYMWVGTDFGVDFLQPGKFKFKNINNTDFKPGALASNDIMSILVDDNKLLLGTSNKGLNVIDRVSGQSIPVPNDIIYGSEGGVLSTLKDQEGNYWIGTWGGGLVKLNLQKKKFKQFLASNSILSGQNITCLAEQNNSIWIGTYDDGLFKIDKNDETFSKFTTNNGLSSNSVYCLAFDSQKRLWVGTNGGGITIFNRKTGKAESVFKYNESNKNSLSSNIVNCIYFDKNKVAWIATDNGLNKYDMPANYFTRY